MRQRLVPVACLSLLAAGCSSQEEPVEWEPVALSDARLVAPTLIQVAANSCHGDPRIAAFEESSDEVLVEVEALVAPAGDQPMCLDMLTIELTTELGARRLVDTTSGTALVVSTE